MKSLIFKCTACSTYSMENVCPKCGSPTISTIPPRFSPQDKYGKYRMKMLYGKE
ncbi:MAG: RNA-protein complex protein Nop10 [Candidatus Thermoplasmatota archaeon]|nr:RNA-protein complex protein Nop10 [Candidatus Thermoplasmatota archaeon]MCL5874013.1 RNA-protein complex protein Nop10 [Candidatus Thermoplasmatota archaeon]